MSVIPPAMVGVSGSHLERENSQVAFCVTATMTITFNIFFFK